MIERLTSWIRASAIVAVCAIPAGCGGPPIGPPPPVPDPPQLSCPSPVIVDGAVGLSQPVTYPAPGVSHGTPPVSVTCSPTSGAMFPLGETTVTCTGVDAAARSATCTFPVTVHHRELTISMFLAYGDSITEGQNGRQLNLLPIIDTANAYPTVLEQFLNSRIPSQRFVVSNAGLGGERVTENEDRLKQVLDARRPQVLLFLEGANDMLAALPAAEIAEGVRESIRRARDRGVQYIFVSTLLPVAPENCPSPPVNCKSVPPGLPAATNQLIRPLVQASGAHLVDPYDEFVANKSTYIGIDGLHLQPEGNRALANAFWNQIVAVIPARQLSR